MAKNRLNCIHADPDRQHGCRILLAEIVCDPENCAWHTTPDQMKESFRTARRIFFKRNGFDGYLQAVKIPFSYRAYAEDS